MSFKLNFFTILIAFFVLQGCVDYRDDPICKNIEYLSFSEFREKGIEVLPSQEIDKAGKIYVYANILLVAEVDQGIHVIDNSDKKNPKPKAFLKIAGNLDMAVKEGYLYVDSYMDLVVIDINNLEKIKEVNRTIDTFSYDPYQSSDSEFYYDENCNFDRSKGIILKGEQ